MNRICIYNSRNFIYLLEIISRLHLPSYLQQQKFYIPLRGLSLMINDMRSTIVEILYTSQSRIYYFESIANLQQQKFYIPLRAAAMNALPRLIYNSRNFIYLLEIQNTYSFISIYNSRNFIYLLELKTPIQIIDLQQQKFYIPLRGGDAAASPYNLQQQKFYIPLRVL